MQDLYFTIRDDAKTSEIAEYILSKVKEYAKNNPQIKGEHGEVTMRALRYMLKVIEEEENQFNKTIKMSGLVREKIKQYLNMEDSFEITLKNF